MNPNDEKRAAFDDAIEAMRDERVDLILFVAGMGPRSTRAVAHARELVRHLGDRCRIEVVDVYESPETAIKSQIVAVPTLVRSSPKPVRKLIGAIASIRDTAKSLGLTLDPASASA